MQVMFRCVWYFWAVFFAMFLLEIHTFCGLCGFMLRIPAESDYFKAIHAYLEAFRRLKWQLYSPQVWRWAMVQRLGGYWQTMQTPKGQKVLQVYNLRWDGVILHPAKKVEKWTQQNMLTTFRSLRNKYRIASQLVLLTIWINHFQVEQSQKPRGRSNLFIIFFCWWILFLGGSKCPNDLILLDIFTPFRPFVCPKPRCEFFFQDAWTSSTWGVPAPQYGRRCGLQGWWRNLHI